MKKTVKIIISILVLAMIVVIGYFIFEKTPASNQSIGGQTDEHGCLGPAGYSWCQAKQKCLRIFEEFCPDQVVKLVSKIEEISSIKLVAGNKTTFNWIVHNEEVLADKTIDGLIYQAEDVKWADYDKLEKFMNETYENDSYNLADGVEGGQRGYLLDYAVCILNFRHAETKQNEEGMVEPVGDNLTVKLECGYFNPNDASKILLEQKIKEILAAKYEKAISEVNIKISKLTELHASGSVFFGLGGPGEGGVFLAMQKDGQWQVVFDGNGSIDCQLMREEYKFPDEILKPNFCD